MKTKAKNGETKAKNGEANATNVSETETQASGGESNVSNAGGEGDTGETTEPGTTEPGTGTDMVLSQSTEGDEPDLSNMTMPEWMARERIRLTGVRDGLDRQAQAIDEQIAGVNRELMAIDAYDYARAGK